MYLNSIAFASCLKILFIKKGVSDFQLAEQLNQWASTDTMDLVEKKSQETFDVLPDELNIPGVNKSIDLELKKVLRKINRDPERLKKLGTST
jgi:hypothetical protein